MAKRRTDADRRARQCERLSRVLRVLQILQGEDRCTVQTIAQELECSERTVYRDLQTLSMAGVPHYFDEKSQTYRLRPGFRRFQFDRIVQENGLTSIVDLIDKSLQSAKETISSLQRLAEFLNEMREELGSRKKQ